MIINNLTLIYYLITILTKTRKIPVNINNDY